MNDLPRPSKILCVGKNYTAHAAEMGGEVPPEPLLFFKPPSALIGHGDAIVVPAGVGRVDYEGEIAVIVGRRARRIREEDAWSHLSHVVPLNDVTARDLQRTDDQWARAKGFDTFCAVGRPAPLDAVDVDALSVTTRVNGEERQRGRASDMAYPIPFLLAFASRIMTLEPGDILTTGTPDGIGPLQPGDVVEVEIPGVGVLRNPVVAEEGAQDALDVAARGAGSRA
ncbi:MAG: fumarylacetoacetate hydrolase family protein [Gemmatimonadetes bacterium]|nr:fumarylacetoacetate hydrolase family protein [Gemmatimonadota bacterium]